MNFGSLDLNTIWFALVGVLLTGYVVLDGFDFGVGMLHLLVAKRDEERRVLLNAIGPVWDGNEVWLLTGGGALFAAFPAVYATVFSGFYLALMALLCALIFRAVAIECRSKHDAPRWRACWDGAFAAGSTVAALLLGVAMGNLARGVPIDADGEFAGSFLGLLNPYSLAMGVTTVVLFALHGALYLVLKTEGELQARVRRWVAPLGALFGVCFVGVTLATVYVAPQLIAAFTRAPWLNAVLAVVVAAILAIPLATKRGKELLALVASAVTIAGLMVLFAVGSYPVLVFSNPSPVHSLTAFNAASSPKTLAVMLTIALIGMPLVIAYTAFIYRIFRGKVKITKTSY
jgi:cytochrome d ubiquinol oxidase subunit II